MHVSARRSKSTLVGLAAFAALGLWSVDSSYCEGPARERPGVEEKHSDKTKQGQANRNAPTRVVVVETAEQRERSEASERQSAEHEAADLQAQRDAADGAQRSAASAERQEIPAFVQIMLATLGTIIAVVAVVVSVVTARRGEATAQAELRAYVGVFRPVGGLTMDPGGQKVAFFIGMKNYGQTPAHKFHFRCQFEVLPQPIAPGESIFDKFPIALDVNDHTTTVLGLWPGDDIECSSGAQPWTFDKTNEILLDENQWLYGFGIAKYQDVFGKWHTTKFCGRWWAADAEMLRQGLPARGREPGEVCRCTWTAHDNESD